jgi:hypothetical protein
VNVAVAVGVTRIAFIAKAHTMRSACSAHF